MCHLPLYFAFQNAGEECRNLSITWFYCFYSPAVLPCSILCVATPVRLRDTAREECVNVLQCRVECRGGKGTNLTDFLLCPNKPVSTFDFRYIYIDTVRHSQAENVIFACLCAHLSLYLWNVRVEWHSWKYDFLLPLHFTFTIFELKLEDTSARQNKIKAGFVLLCSCLYVSLSLWR